MESTQDQSIQMLGDLFDYQSIIANLHGTGAGAVQPGALLSMFNIFNSFAMLATGFVIIYMWSVAIMHTAHEGEPLGKRYSTLWTPIRTVASALFVSPFPGLGGFSVLQALILLLVSLSISGANTLFNAEMSFFKDNGGTLMPISQSPYPSVDDMRTILSGETCAEYMRDNNWESMSFSATKSGNTGLLSWAGSSGGFMGLFASQKSCGKIEVDCSAAAASKGATDLCWARFDALKAMAPKLNAIADDVYAGKQPKSGALQNAVDTYASTWKQSVSKSSDIRLVNGNYQIQLPADKQQAVNDLVNNAQNTGWITAGQWYWTISAMSLANKDMASPRVTREGFKPDDIPDYQQSFQPKLALLTKYLSVDGSNVVMGNSALGVSIATGQTAAQSSDSSVSGLFGKIWSSSVSSHTITSLVTDGGDPIRNLASYGQDMIGSGWSVIAAATAAKAVAGAAGSNVVGEAANLVTGWKGAAKAIVGTVFSLLLVGAAWLIGMGITLAYYVPAVPFVFWTFAILGWLIMVVESLLAAPLWGASHAVPEGDGFAGRYAMQGWQLMVNVVMRPMFLTIGLLLSFFLMHLIITYAVKGFGVYMDSVVASTSSIAVTGYLASTTIMIALVIVLAHKSAEMIYETADNIMKWIGFGTSSLGSVRSEGEVKGMAKGASGTTERLAGAGLGRLGASGGGGRRPIPGDRTTLQAGHDHTAGNVSGGTEAPQKVSSPGNSM